MNNLRVNELLLLHLCSTADFSTRDTMKHLRCTRMQAQNLHTRLVRDGYLERSLVPDSPITVYAYRLTDASHTLLGQVATLLRTHASINTDTNILR